MFMRYGRTKKMYINAKNRRYIKLGMLVIIFPHKYYIELTILSQYNFALNDRFSRLGNWITGLF